MMDSYAHLLIITEEVIFCLIVMDRLFTPNVQWESPKVDFPITFSVQGSH